MGAGTVAQPTRYLWTVPMRALLAVMWLVHGLEKFGVEWPGPLNGGTQSVADMLDLMVEVSPVAPLQALVSTVMLPAAPWLQTPVGLLEVGLALALASGVLLPWAALLGAGMQTFFWLGYLGFDWPLQYPLVVVAHLALAAPRFLPQVDTGDGWLTPVRIAVAGVWVYAGALNSPWLLAAGVFIAGGLGSRALTLALLPVIAGALSAQSWGLWPWSYYLVGAAHLAVAVGARAEGLALARAMPPGIRRLVA